MSTTVISFLLVALGGGLGSASRYGLSLLSRSYIPAIPWISTFSVNVIGSFLIALFFVISKEYYPHSPYFSPLFVLGFCGGFTTFSTFTMDVYKLYQSGDVGMAILYVVLSIVISFVALLLGFYVGNRIVR